METTDTGDLLLNHARMLLALNDEALHALRGIAIEGTVRLGATTDVAEDYLPDILKSFAAAHARVKLEVVVERSHELVKSYRAGKLDLALALGEMPGGEILGRQKVMWIAARDFKLDPRQPSRWSCWKHRVSSATWRSKRLNGTVFRWRIAVQHLELVGLARSGESWPWHYAAYRNNAGRGPALRPAKPEIAGARPPQSVALRLKAPASPAVAKLANLVRDRLSSALRAAH